MNPRLWPAVHPAIAPLLRIETELRRAQRTQRRRAPLDPVARFLADGGRITHLPEHVTDDELHCTAMPSPNGEHAPELADEARPTPEQALMRMVLTLAVADAINGGGTRTPVKDRPRVKQEARAWFRDGHWRAQASAAGFDLGAKEREFREQGLLP